MQQGIKTLINKHWTDNNKYKGLLCVVATAMQICASTIDNHDNWITCLRCNGAHIAERRGVSKLGTGLCTRHGIPSDSPPQQGKTNHAHIIRQGKESITQWTIPCIYMCISFSWRLINQWRIRVLKVIWFLLTHLPQCLMYHTC